jgi:protein TonB
MEPRQKDLLTRKTIILFLIGVALIAGIVFLSVKYRPYYSSFTSDSTTWTFFDDDTLPPSGDEGVHPEVPVIPPPTPSKKIPRRQTKDDSVEIDLEIDDTIEPDLNEDLRPFPPVEPVHTIVDKPASFPGGVDGFREYLQRNLKYPIQASRNEIEGRVYVEFIVEKNGRLSEVKSIKGIGNGCDEEAVRLVSSSRPWKPAVHHGDTVRQKVVFPVEFDLPKRRRNNK